MLWILPQQEIGHAGVHLLDSGRAQACHRLGRHAPRGTVLGRASPSPWWVWPWGHWAQRVPSTLLLFGALNPTRLF